MVVLAGIIYLAVTSWNKVSKKDKRYEGVSGRVSQKRKRINGKEIPKVSNN